MGQTRLTTWQKATALVPLALLSGAWTASLTVSPTPAASAAEKHQGSLPDGSSVPNRAIKSPASVSQPGSIAPGVPAGSTQSVIDNADVAGIPAAALHAYQRSARVIDAADPSCHIDWQLIAAIGRVESDHGRYDGNTLNAQGRSVPGIYGIPLDGSNGTARVSDTDGGRYDDDQVYDRAVGPMQFIPATWSVVGVDGDGDGVRDPQDIDDAALATAVYLCSGQEDLATYGGRRAAVYRYNHSQDYVDLVMGIRNAYVSGNYAEVPNGIASPRVFAPLPPAHFASPPPGRKQHTRKQHHNRHHTGQHHGGTSHPADNGTGTSPRAPATPDGSDGTGNAVKKGGGKVNKTVKDATKDVKKATDDAGKDTKQTVVDMQKAVQLCTSALRDKYGKAPDKAVSRCADRLVGKTLSDAQSTVGDVVADLSGLVQGLLGGSGGGGLLGSGGGDGGGSGGGGLLG